MIIKIIEPLEVSSGRYNSVITEINEVSSKSICLVKLQPYDKDSIYEEVLLWIDEECNTKSAAYKFFQTLGITTDEIIIEDLREEFLNSKIGIEIEDNEASDGRIYHNIVGFFAVGDDSDDDFEDEDEEDDSDDEEEDDLEDEEDSDDSEEESGNGTDDFEDIPKRNVTESSRRSNNRRNRRR